MKPDPIRDLATLRARLESKAPLRLSPIHPGSHGLSVQCAACHRMRPTGRALAALSEPAGTYLCAGCLADAARVPRDPRDLT